jgi:hypothetical protein
MPPRTKSKGQKRGASKPAIKKRVWGSYEDYANSSIQNTGGENNRISQVLEASDTNRVETGSPFKGSYVVTVPDKNKVHHQI